jgi:fluoride exporter
MAKQLLWIALGGSAGSVLRFLSQKYAGQWLGEHFPFGTLLVNITGCLLIGIFYDISSRQDTFTPELRLLLMTGFCGGFTTFSAFSLESLAMLQQDRLGAVITYTLLSVASGLLAVWAGYWISRSVF